MKYIILTGIILGALLTIRAIDVWEGIQFQRISIEYSKLNLERSKLIGQFCPKGGSFTGNEMNCK